MVATTPADAAGPRARGRPRVVTVVPIAPSTSGNGLAMRAARLVRGLAREHDVDVVVLPVAGVLDPELARPPAGPIRTCTLPLPDSPRHLALTRAEMIDPRWRERLRRVLPLPPGVPVLPPTLADDVLRALPDDAPSHVWALRYGVLPVARALAGRWDVPLAVDLDDDDVGFLEQTGAAADAYALDRLLREDASGAALLTAAGATAAAAIEARLGRPVAVVPNGVALPADPGPPTPRPADAAATLLFVANFAYAPNRHGAAWLVNQVLASPRLRHAVRVRLVGPGATGALPAGPFPLPHRVEAVGPVSDLAAEYGAADLVVAPILDGGGTSTKVPEAAAHRRAVVATPLAARDLGLLDDLHLRVAASPDAFASAIDDLVRSPADADRLASAARELVASSCTDEHAQATVAALVRRLSP